MAHPVNITRLVNFTRNLLDGLDFDNPGLDAELDQVCLELGQLNARLRGITTADGALRFTDALREMNLMESLEFTATNAQTAFTVAAYDTAVDGVEVYVNGLLVAPSDVTLTNSTTVTIPACTTGDTVVINVFSSGAGALVQLASTALNLGASLVSIHDTGGLITATNVETALAELATSIATLTTNIGTIGNYIKKTGTVAFTADQSMGGFKLTGLAAATANGDAVRYEQFIAYANIWDDLAANFLELGGGTMSGDLNMGGNSISDVADPVSDDDAANKGYVDGVLNDTYAPIGSVLGYACVTMPSAQWLVCDGSAVSRATYATLAARMAVDGYPWGVGDGSTTFNLPDLRGRVIVGVGAGSGLTARSLADNGGEEEHTLDTTELPSHTHGGYGYNGNTTIAGGGGTIGFANPATSTTGATGGGQSHENMQPYRCLQYMIRVL